MCSGQLTAMLAPLDMAKDIYILHSGCGSSLARRKCTLYLDFTLHACGLMTTRSLLGATDLQNVDQGSQPC
jgi:hypothetical protein